jgi:STAS-like domain of unknown function (DUF4325)
MRKVELSKFEWEVMISRSQAKRILTGLEKFKYVTLDFKGVRLVGQGFADEVFRVFKNRYPDIQIDYINANDDVKFMIERSIKTSH